MSCALAVETATAQVATTAVMAVYIQGSFENHHHQTPLADQGALGLADDILAVAENDSQLLPVTAHNCCPYLSHR